MTVEHDLYNNIGDIDVCTDFAMLEVKLTLPIIFLGIVGFSPLGRDVTEYCSTYMQYVRIHN